MLYIFDKNEKLLEIIDDYIECEMERELNGDWTLDLKIDINTTDNIKRKNKIGFEIDDKFYLFSIEEIEDTYFSDDIKNIYCHNDIFNLNDHIIEDKRCNNYTVEKALEKALEGTNYKVGNVDSFDANTCNFYYISSLSALKTIVELYGCEYDTRIEYNTETNTLDKYVDLKTKLGQETGLRFTYDTNLISIKRTEVADNHYNVLYGRGGSVPITDGEGNETGGYTRLIDFSDITWSIDNGNPCDKPSGQTFVEDMDSIEKYGRLEGIYENKDISNKTLLLQSTYEKLQETKEPSVSYEINVNDIKDVQGFEHYNYTLGDRIIILDEDYNIDLESRIIKEVIDIKEKNKTVTLGYVLPSQSSITASGNIIDPSNNKSEDDYNFSDEDFPNTLPETPVLTVDREGFASISLSWTFENKPYYTYELYASQSENFNPTENHLIFKGHSSAFLHEINFNETWYYRVRCTNSHGQSTNFSNEVSATTYKIDDATEIFEKAAIKEALIESLNADKIITGKVKGTFIDARNLSVTDGNGDITFSVSSDGIVKIIQGLINIDNEGIKINLIDSEENILGYVLYDGQGVQIFTTEDELISNFTREGSYIDKVKIDDIDCNQIMKIATRSGCSKSWYVAAESTGDGTGRNESNKANSLADVLRRIRGYGLYFADEVNIYVESGNINEDIVIQDIHGTVIKINFAKGVILNTDKFIIEDCSARIFLNGEVEDGNSCLDDEITSEELNKRALIKTNNTNLFRIYNCAYVRIEGFRLRGNSGNCVGVYNGSNVFIKDCDISNFEYGAYTDDMSKVCIGSCRGSLGYLAYIGYGGIFSSTASIPKCSETNIVDNRQSGMWVKENSYNQHNTLYTEATTSQPSTNITDIFEITDLYTKVEGTGNNVNGRNGYVGQGKFQNYKAHRGYIILPSEILSRLETKDNYTLKLRMTRLNTKHGYNSKTPHPIIRAVGNNITTEYWDSNVKFNRGDTNDIVLPDTIVDAIKQGATRLELWAETNQQQQYSFYNNINLIIEGANKDTTITDITQTTFTYADELVENAMTYWRNCDNEGSDWEVGTVYRASNTVASGTANVEKGVTGSIWVNCNGTYYKAIDCSTLVCLSLQDYNYSNSPYSSLSAFNTYRANRTKPRTGSKWGMYAGRSAADIGEYFYNKGWIIPLSSIGNADNNYSGLKKGDILFYARKNEDGTYKQPSRFMNISHVAIVGDISSSTGKRNLIESTTPTSKKHTVNGKEFNAGCYVGSIASKYPETIVLVARIQL